MPQPLQNREFMWAEQELPVHYKPKGEEQFICGTMRNYSEAGICFETGYLIRPGTEIWNAVAEEKKILAGEKVVISGFSYNMRIIVAEPPFERN